MASLIPGYEYDIFISYRQKDNRGERWVSEFVEALKIELESTFKEEVSVYFDVNPHDGLLETHEVNESLKEKLKCLVFIPVISRTYCDPKSFAWEHEFKAFIENASHDQFGLKIKLSRGNVASRVLPVRIHDLDSEDVKLCEAVTDGVLRGIEFIYKEPGVNRPLAPDDDEKINLNKTKYRNQINKVANAVNEIIRGLKLNINSQEAEVKIVEKSDLVFHREGTETPAKVIKRLYYKNPLTIILLSLLLVIGAYLIFRHPDISFTEKSLALIPLRISNNDSTLQSDADYFLEALTDKLNLIRKIGLKPSISTLSFRNTSKTIEEISRELGAKYLVYGNIRREGSLIKIWIELSEGINKEMLWSRSYVWENNDAAIIIHEVVSEVTKYMNIKLTDEDKRKVISEPSKFPTASQNYISANRMLRDAWSYINYGDRMLDSTSFSSAILSYDKAIKEDSLFALAYAKRALAITWGFFNKQLDSSYLERCRKDIEKALLLDKNLPEVQSALGFYYYYCEIDYDKALLYFGKAAELDPQNYQPLYYQSLVYRKMGRWNESQSLINKVIRLNPKEALFLTNIGLSYTYLHKFDSAIIFHDKAIDLVPSWPAAYDNKIIALLLRDGNTSGATSVLEEATRRTGDRMVEYRIMLNLYDRNYIVAFQEASDSHIQDFNFNVDKYIFLIRICYLTGRNEEVKHYCDSALLILKNDLILDPYNSELHGYAGIAHAYLGNRTLAVEEGEKAIKFAMKNKMVESEMKINLAKIHTILGEFDDATSLIAYLLNNPSVLSEELLKKDPVWKPLMDNPQYSQRIMEYAKN
jgi:tetratricopeptide (TPR) repeat protein